MTGVTSHGEQFLAQESLELGEELALEGRAQDLQWNEITTAVEEALGAEAATCDETVNVRMVTLLLVPGVEHGEDRGEGRAWPPFRGSTRRRRRTARPRPCPGWLP